MGQIVAESDAAEVVDVASTTKIMTALVVLRAVRDTPRALDETVSFSERAAGTQGSSCGLNAGDAVSVRDLLYALLVRSGNDAAIALAEHFGRRFDPPSKRSDDPVSRFVAEMNREARRLGLSATKYANPNGLPEKGHRSSALDLVRLSVEARKLSLFREIVATRAHEAEATTRNGTVRKLTWKTTNRLLAIEGYDGIKTGYTRAAGSCLVSSARRGRDELIVVVLGAPSAGAAAADSRNLYRWAWRERGHSE
jgi:D-alanyl-D-alanine carboxypeptidase (penicillin-binding protein 5/6)